MSGEIILIVDDNPELLEGITLTLEMEGFQVLTADSGQSAFHVLNRVVPDLILADIMMPQMDGYDLYELVHSDSRWLHVPFIFLTAKTSKEDIRRGKMLGVDDYITKPFDPQDVVASVRGKLKRVSELTGRPTSSDVGGNLRALWRGKVGPIPMPLILALVAVAMVAAPFFIFGGPKTRAVNDTPLRPDVGQMVDVPKGPFTKGSDDVGAAPAETLDLPAFQIDKYEVTNGQYHVFVQETGYVAPWGTYPEEKADYPVTGVSWDDARAYCEWAGKRLPTDAEWEKAARGTDARAYPWGDSWDPALTNTSEGGVDHTQPVGSYPDGASPYGVMDMAGNVWEWVADWADANQETKIMRGGAWNAIGEKWARAFMRNTSTPNVKRDNLGFRCAR